MSDDKVVGLNGAPVPALPYDQGIMTILEDAIADVKKGEVIGVGVVTIHKEDGPGAYGTSISYQGPRLSIMAGCYRMAHRINLALDHEHVEVPS